MCRGIEECTRPRKSQIEQGLETKSSGRRGVDWRGKPSLETKWFCDPIRSRTLAGGQGKALRGNHRIRFASPTVTLAAA